jgi:epoxyqueuosine reductase
LLSLDEAGFRALFSGSPVKRIGYVRFLRNLLIAAGNSGDSSLAGTVEARLTHESALIRAMAIYALCRLSPTRLRKRAKVLAAHEEDADVAAEWSAALAQIG